MPTNRHSSNTRWSEPTWRDGYQLLAKSLEKKTQTLYTCVPSKTNFLIQKRCVHFDKHTRNILEITKSCSIFSNLQTSS